MSKIIINAGCCNGLDSKQYDLLDTIEKKIKALWPEVVAEDTELGRCYWKTTYKNDKVELSYTTDSSD